MATNHPEQTGMVLLDAHHQNHEPEIESTAVFLQHTAQTARDPYRYYHQYYHQHYHSQNRQLDVGANLLTDDFVADRSSTSDRHEMTATPSRYPSTYQDPDSTVLEPTQDHEAGEVVREDVESVGHECHPIILNQERVEYHRRHSVQGKHHDAIVG